MNVGAKAVDDVADAGVGRQYSATFHGHREAASTPNGYRLVQLALEARVLFNGRCVRGTVEQGRYLPSSGTIHVRLLFLDPQRLATNALYLHDECGRKGGDVRGRAHWVSFDQKVHSTKFRVGRRHSGVTTITGVAKSEQQVPAPRIYFN